MLAAERRNRILEKLHDDNHVIIGELAVEFDVSEETIRRDLDKLGGEGMLTRTYGGAVSIDAGKTELAYEIRKRENVSEKLKIANVAAQLMADGDCVMLDESSTTSYIAKAMRRSGLKGMTVITNSIDIINELFNVKDWNIISTGGNIKENSHAMTGYRAENMLRTYHADISVISCTTIDKDLGFANKSDESVAMKRAMMASAKKTILAADSSKFNKMSFAEIGKLSEVDILLTDCDPGTEWRRILQEAGTELIIAD